jgi:hypothetical protein
MGRPTTAEPVWRAGATRVRGSRWFRWTGLIFVCIGVTGVAATGVRTGDSTVRTSGRTVRAAPATPAPATTNAPAVITTTTPPPPPRFEGWVDPASAGQPYYTATVPAC